MLFNSFEFIFVFLPLSVVLYYFLTHKRLVEAAKGLLVFASLTFYSYWNIRYLPLILSSMLFNYIIGNLLSGNTRSGKSPISKKSVLFFGVTANLGLLGFFKYSDFFLSNLNIFLSHNIELLHLALPLAISFFTFQQIAYLVDSYRGETKEYDFLNYAVFVSFFPQLIAGPIVHHREMMPQFARLRNKLINYRHIAMGLFLFSMGLFKKVIIADTFSVWANVGFDTAANLNFIEAWSTSLSYTFQLYFDFSGYTDMALGIGLLFNIKLPINFNSPYKALSIQDFWRRWHITLSRFLRDYIYIPLGGSRKGDFRTSANLLVTFVLGGLWHGAGWTFVFWGFLHGSALVIERLWRKTGWVLPRLLAWFITFNCINIAWIFFRANTWQDALKVLKGMFSFDSIVLGRELYAIMPYLSKIGITFGDWISSIQGDKDTLLWIFAGFILIHLKNSMEQLENFKPTIWRVLMASSLFAYSVISLNNSSDFLYFNF